ncbi:MAG: hypothetical protein RLZZ28_2429 [Bacteroidota bacterium]
MVLHLIGNTELRQLLRLPKVFEHYRYHSALNPRLGFINFISQHYIGDDEDANDDAQDNELPFRRFCHQLIIVAIAPPAFFETEKQQANFINKLGAFYRNPLVLKDYYDTLLRPPRQMV